MKKKSLATRIREAQGFHLRMFGFYGADHKFTQDAKKALEELRKQEK